MTFPTKPGIKSGLRVTVSGVTNIGGFIVPANTRIIVFRGKKMGFVSIPSLNKIVNMGEIE